jgi:hypothetical protein
MVADNRNANLGLTTADLEIITNGGVHEAVIDSESERREVTG